MGEKRMTKRMFHDSIALIPGSAGWWHSDGGDTYRKLGDDLIAHGFTTDEALAFLDSAYGAAASEFGQ